MAEGDESELLRRADPTSGLPSGVALLAAEDLLRRAGGVESLEAGAARAAMWVCTHLFRLGRLDAALSRAIELLPRMSGADVVASRCETLRLAALAACELGRFTQAFDLARELGALASSGDDDDRRLIAAYTLGACLDRIGDPWQAARVLADMLDAVGARATPRTRLIALIGQCAFLGGGYHRLGDEADSELGRDLLRRCRIHAELALATLPSADEPLHRVAVFHNLAEVLLYQGELESSRRLLDESIAAARSAGVQAHLWRALVTRAAWLLRHGDASPALEAVERLLQEMDGGAPPNVAMRAHDIGHRAARELERFDVAYQHLRAFERLERQRTLAELRALSELFVTRVESQRIVDAAERARREADLQQRRASDLQRRVEQDPLTALGNRTYLWRRVAEVRSTDPPVPATMAMVDIDHFKDVNDRYGHAVGDTVLVAVADMLRIGTRADDVLARWGGEEFAIILPHTDLTAAREVCERLRRSIADRCDWPGLPVGQRVTVSIGLASGSPQEVSTWLQRADLALYRAKRDGRNQIAEADLDSAVDDPLTE